MKKTLLAIAITGLFTAGAQAATVYDADGTTIDLGADIEINYSKSGLDVDADTAMSVDDADISAKITQMVNDGLYAFGKVELDADDNNTADLDTALVGLSSDEMGTIYFGKQVTIKDDSGIFNDYKLGVSGLEVNAASSGDQVIRYKYANDSFYFGAAYAMNLEETEGSEGDLSAIDGNIGFTGVENLELVVYLGSTDVTEDEAETYAQFQGIYTVDNLKLSVIAATTSYDGESGSGFGGQIAYTMDKATYSLGIQTVDTADITDGVDQTDYFAGVGYALTSNSTAYAQIGGSDADDTDMGFAVGIDFGF
jgi:predicted porin